MKEYYIYEMHELLSPTGKPYIGSSCDFYFRACNHKSKLKLDKRPKLFIIDGPYYTRTEAKRAEQPFRIANGWPDEREANSRGGKIGGPISSKRNKENGTGFCVMSEETKFDARSKAGKGKIWINDGTTNKRINPDELEKYHQLGFSQGQVRK